MGICVVQRGMGHQNVVFYLQQENARINYLLFDLFVIFWQQPVTVIGSYLEIAFPFKFKANCFVLFVCAVGMGKYS